MRRKVVILLMIVVFIILLVTYCSATNKQLVVGDSTLKQAENSISPIADASAENGSAQDDAKTGDTTSAAKFSSVEEAYYSKYFELAKKYGTYSLYDFYSVKNDYNGRSYLNGVCVVNLMDFNGDGIEDLFVVYSNGEMEKTISDNYNLEIYDFPTENTYEIEIWTYKDGELTQILHEPHVSVGRKYPNSWLNSYYEYFRAFINVYENKNGFPVIQIFNDKDEQREYTNIYYSNRGVVRDEFVHDGETFQMNDSEIEENIWRKNIAGFNKILSCSLLADSTNSSENLIEIYNVDYNNTLLQTERVIRYLSKEDSEKIMPRFNIAEEEYVSLYLQELEPTNCQYFSQNYMEDHHFILYDMDQNGTPELILYEGTSGAGTHYHFYTIINGEVVECGDYGRTVLMANGEGGLIAYHARMDNYTIDKITLDGDKIQIQEIAEGTTKIGGGMPGPYPELEQLGYYNYEYLAFCPPTFPMALYTYNQEVSRY